ncbi:hypothetical protein BS78_07G008500 [Paspalum vaginatum]|nr:hypothetical protein BS78_07G008500 [Paspalum vaginatum]
MVCCSGGVSVAVGGALYALTDRSSDDHPVHLEAMSWRADADAVPHCHRPTTTERCGGWSWKAMPPPPPEFRSAVSSYALHPDGRTIFMTTATNRSTIPGFSNPLGTYSFNTEESKWRWHGEWALPFDGQAHFDADLDAWVGLARIKGGHICCCRPVSPTYYNERAPTVFLPDFKTTKEKLFGKHPQRGHMGACLTYMHGRGGRFCLVECMSSKKPASGDDDGFLLHVTVFGLKYDRKGELQTTRRQSTRSFSVPRHSYLFSPFAFWM